MRIGDSQPLTGAYGSPAEQTTEQQINQKIEDMILNPGNATNDLASIISLIGPNTKLYTQYEPLLKNVSHETGDALQYDAASFLGGLAIQQGAPWTPVLPVGDPPSPADWENFVNLLNQSAPGLV